MKNKRYIFILIIALLFVACGKEEVEVSESIEEFVYPMEEVDGLGNIVYLEKEPERIISLTPNSTEILFSLELDEKIVGVSNFCDYPEEALEKEKVGDAFSLDIEKIIELEPDLIIAYGEIDEKLEELTITSFNPQSIGDIKEEILKLGIMTNSFEKAEELVVEMDEKINIIKENSEGKERPKVFYEVYDEPLMTAGKDTFISEIIEIAGGDDIAKDLPAYSEYDLEMLIDEDPDFYISYDFDENNIGENPEFSRDELIKARNELQDLRAVKENKVFVLNPDIISRPGPRIIDALEILADIFHGE